MHLTESDLAQRRKSSSRFAWMLGTIAARLYVIGFFIER